MDSARQSIVQSLLVLWHLRQAGGRLTIEELARRMNLPTHRIHQLIADLSMVRVASSPYEYVDILVEDDIVDLGPATHGLERGALVLSPGEFLALVHAVKEVEEAGLGITLRACLPLLQRLAGSLGAGDPLPVAFSSTALPPEWVDVRDVAIPHRHVLAMDYWTASRDQVTHREVVPVRLQNDGGTWYLRAWCLIRNEMRSFRLDRVLRHVDTGRVHSEPLPDDPETATVGQRMARVRFDPEIATWAEERFAEARSLPDGSCEVSIPFLSEDLFASWILSMSGHARVLDPPDLRKRIGQRVRESFRTDRSRD